MQAKVWLQKSIAALQLFLAAIPVVLLVFHSTLPLGIGWVLIPLSAYVLGVLCFLVPGKKRGPISVIVAALYTGISMLLLLQAGYQILAVLPCAVLLFVLPLSYARAAYAEWPLGLWIAGMAAHIVVHYLATRPSYLILSVPLRVCTAVYALLFLWTANRQQLQRGMHDDARPPQSMRGTNGMLVTALFGVALVGACIEPLIKAIGAAWDVLMRGIARVVGWLLSLFAPTEIAVQQSEGVQEEMMALAEETEPSRLLQILEQIMIIITAVLVAVVLLWVIFFLAKRAYRLIKKLLERLRAYMGAAGDDYIDQAESTLDAQSMGREARRRLHRLVARPVLRPGWRQMDGRARVRYLFSRYRGRHAAITDAMTAREAMQDTPDFAALYERARYSDHPILEEEAEKARDVLKL